MKIKCPNCGKNIEVNGLGRKALDIPLIIVYDALKTNHSIRGAANELKCSPAYIYKILKSRGFTAADIIGGRVIKEEFVSG